MGNYPYGMINEKNEVVTVENKNTWCIKDFGDTRRLTVAPSSNAVDLALEIVKGFEEPLKVVYLLFRPGGESVERGRYLCPDFLTHNDVEKFCSDFREFLESDGRHHLWIFSAYDIGKKQFLIFDNHRLLHVYDNVDRVKEMLQAKGFTEEDITVPVPEPHAHLSIPDNNKYEQELLNYWNWQRSPFKHKVKEDSITLPQTIE